MAASGAKVIYPRNTNNSANNIGTLEYYKPYSNELHSSNNMEDDVVNQLQATSFEKRMRALEEMRNASRRNGGCFPYPNQRRVFDALSNALSDSKNDVRLLCVQLILEIIPSYADRGNLDECMAIVIPKMIPNLGDATVAFRRQIIQTLHVYMKHTSNLQGLLRAIVQYGLEYPDQKVKKEVIVALPMLFTPEFSKENFFEVAQSLAKRLLDSSLGDASVKQMILFSLEKIHKLVGDHVFESYVQKLSAPLRKYYLKLTNKEDFQNEKNSSAASYSRRNSQQSNGHVPKGEQSAFQYSPTTNRHNFYKANAHLEFGVVPSHVMDKLNDQTNFRTRAQAVEELKVIINDLDKRGIEALSPNILNFISFLNNLLDDSNFKITTVTLEILGILVQQLSIGIIRTHLKSHMSCLTKRMGDNKIVIRQAIMKVIMQLMQILSPKPVLSVITENLSNRNSRVRQETLNIIIASLLTFPSYDFDLGILCTSIAHTLVDPKRQVRQAALECFAVIAQAMGAGKLQPLVGAVDSVELSYDGDGVMAAVQARLTRRQLPKLNADGLVDYATPVPSSGTARGNAAAPTGPDIEWILQGSGSSGTSARSTRSEQMDLESVASSARSTPANFIQDTGPTPRRYPSAGKNRARLPWEDEQTSETSYSSRQGNPSDSRESRNQVKPKTTWGGEDFGNDTKNRSKKKFSGGNSRDQSPEPGSYRQIHMNKYRRQMNDGSGAGNPPFTVYGGKDNNDIDSPTTAPFIPDWGESSDDRKVKGGVDKTAPIPTKPALVRSVSSKRKVPPIPIDGSKGFYRDDDGLDSARDSIFDDDEESPDMNLSLRKIRNSASKKKVEKIFQRLESMESQQSRSPSPPSTAGESGIYSSTSMLKHDREHRNNRPGELPFENKPRMAHRKSSPPPMLDQNPMATDSRTSISGQDSKQYADYKPHGGVTFMKNPNADVAIVGKGYSDHSPGSDINAGNYGNKNKDRRRQSKSVLSPLGMASTHNHGQTDMDDDKVPGGVVGKGMFDTSPNGSDHSMSGAPGERRERRVSRTDSQNNLPRGVYGVRVRTNSQGQSSDDSDDDEEDDVASMSMSKSTREHLEKKFRLKQEEAERERVEQRAERERERQRRAKEQDERRRQEEDRIKREKERQQEKLRKLSTQTEDEIKGLAISGSSQPGSPPLNNNTITNANGVPSRKLANKPTAKRKTKPPANEGPTHPSSAKAGEIEPSENLKCFNDPHIAYTEAMKMVANEEWDIKCTGINNIRRLVIHHPEVISGGNLHTVNVALIQEVRNLRSQVSRLGIVCLGDMYSSLKKNMDVDLDQTTKVLLAKNGESSNFIREDVDQTLCTMVECVTPQRAMVALISGGASHKNVAVRKITAQYLVTVVERMGPGRVLSGIKDLTDKILPVASQFLTDPNPATRYNGQKILYMLMSHEDFDKMMNKHVSMTLLRNVQDKLDNLKRKGLGEPPAESMSARARRSGQGSRSNSMTRGSSATSDAPSQSSASSRRTTRTDESTMEDIKNMCASMSASDWRDRQKGIQQLLDMIQANPVVIGNNITKVFDKFVPCLKDSNSKVNVFALKSMERVVPALKDYMSGVVSLTVQTVSSNISSKNQEIYKAAADTLDLFMEHLEPSLLLQPFANQAQSGNARIKPDMINRVAYLTNEVYSKKQKQVILHVLPLLWHLLGSTPSSGAVPGGTGNLRTAIAGLVQILYTCMGPTLLDHANNTSTVTPRMQQALQDMIDNP